MADEKKFLHLGNSNDKILYDKFKGKLEKKDVVTNNKLLQIFNFFDKDGNGIIESANSKGVNEMLSLWSAVSTSATKNSNSIFEDFEAQELLANSVDSTGKSLVDNHVTVSDLFNFLKALVNRPLSQNKGVIENNEEQQDGENLAKEMMLFADDNNSAVSKKEFQNKLNRMEKLSTQDLIKFIRSFDKEESIIELIVDEVGSDKKERKDACKKVLLALTSKAKELGIDTKDFEQQFIDELDFQFNSWGTVNTDKLDKIINAITQSIENRQNFTSEDLEKVKNTSVIEGQEQSNNIIENRLENAYSDFGERVGEDGEMTIKDKAGNLYNGQMQRDGIAADIADGVSRIWGSENTATKVRKDLKAANIQLKELKEAKSQGEEAYRAKFKEIFGIEYDYANILAYQKNEELYINVSSKYELETYFNRSLKTLLSSAPLQDEVKTGYTGEVYLNQIIATKEQVYNREFNNLAELLTHKEPNGNEIKGSEIINRAFKEKGVANGTIKEKFEVLKQIAKSLSNELHKSTLEAGGGKEFSEVQAMYDNSYKAAYGVENDIMKRVTDYNISQEMGAGVVKAGTTIVVSLVTALTGCGLVGVAAWTAGATVGAEVIDRGTSGKALDALREQGLGEYLETVGKDVDWEATFKQAAMSGGAVLIGGGVAQGVTAIMAGKSSVAQFATMLGSDVVTDVAWEFLTTKEITWQGMVFTVLFSTIGNATQIKQMKKAVSTDIDTGIGNKPAYNSRVLSQLESFKHYFSVEDYPNIHKAIAEISVGVDEPSEILNFIAFLEDKKISHRSIKDLTFEDLNSITKLHEDGVGVNDILCYIWLKQESGIADIDILKNYSSRYAQISENLSQYAFSDIMSEIYTLLRSLELSGQSLSQKELLECLENINIDSKNLIGDNIHFAEYDKKKFSLLIEMVKKEPLREGEEISSYLLRMFNDERVLNFNLFDESRIEENAKKISENYIDSEGDVGVEKSNSSFTLTDEELKTYEYEKEIYIVKARSTSIAQGKMKELGNQRLITYALKENYPRYNSTKYFQEHSEKQPFVKHSKYKYQPIIRFLDVGKSKFYKSASDLVEWSFPKVGEIHEISNLKCCFTTPIGANEDFIISDIVIEIHPKSETSNAYFIGGWENEVRYGVDQKFKVIDKGLEIVDACGEGWLGCRRRCQGIVVLQED